MRSLILIVLVSSVSACISDPYGYSTPYSDHVSEAVSVAMPDNAPSISAQMSLQSPAADAVTKSGEHRGVDIVESIGAPVLAATQATVLRSFYEPTFGHQVYLDHGTDSNGTLWVTKYRHLDTRNVAVGDKVRRGYAIGTVGKTGMMAQFFPHLHFELWQKPEGGSATPVDPNRYWLEGVGNVTCFERKHRNIPSPDKLTYPVECKDG